MTSEQTMILRDQVQELQTAVNATTAARQLLHRMLILVDPRFADPATGVRFDPRTLTITEPAEAEPMLPASSVDPEGIELVEN